MHQRKSSRFHGHYENVTCRTAQANPIIGTQTVRRQNDVTRVMSDATKGRLSFIYVRADRSVRGRTVAYSRQACQTTVNRKGCRTSTSS